MLLSVVGKSLQLVQYLDCGGKLHEGQAGFPFGRSCMDNVYVLNEVVQGRLQEDNVTYDVKKAYDTLWCDGLWLK